MIGAADRLFLRRAVELAGHGLYSVSGNPRVGCVIVRDGAVIGRGWHRCAGGPHAEVNAIADAGGDVQGATVYVSLEPCCHTGRQPPCVDALIRHRVARVVAALRDPDPRVSGRGGRVRAWAPKPCFWGGGYATIASSVVEALGTPSHPQGTEDCDPARLS